MTYMWHQADTPASRDVPAYRLAAFLLVNFVLAHIRCGVPEVRHLFLDVT